MRRLWRIREWTVKELCENHIVIFKKHIEGKGNGKMCRLYHADSIILESCTHVQAKYCCPVPFFMKFLIFSECPPATSDHLPTSDHLSTSCDKPPAPVSQFAKLQKQGFFFVIHKNILHNLSLKQKNVKNSCSFGNLPKHHYNRG